ncbi:MAG: hypothetical protein ACI97A_002858 [Planctomycetota bacterium]|jgi:hypothetical protein
MAPAIWLKPQARATPDGQRLMRLLNLQPEVQKRIWTLEAARVASGPDLETSENALRSALKLRMRSLYNVLNQYSYAVSFPLSDEVEGRATDLSSFRAAIESGAEEDYAKKAVIRHSQTRPQSTIQSVQYRGL